MLRYIVKNLSGLSSRSEESPQRYRNRLFRSLSPASRYNETNEKTLETKNTLKRSQSFTKLNSIGGENLQTSWFPRIRESHKRQASQTTQFHKRQKRNRISLRAGKDLELYYRDTPIGTKFFTHEKYQLEAATPRKPDRNSNYNILENIQKLEQTVKSSGSKNLHYPSKMLKTKTKRIHSVALPKLINEQDDYEQLAKKSRKNDDFTVYPIHSTVSYHLQQNEENPVQLIQDLPVGGYAATPTIPPPPKGFSSLNQDVNFVEEAATDQADNPPKDVKAFDDSFQADRLLDDETKGMFLSFSNIALHKKPPLGTNTRSYVNETRNNNNNSSQYQRTNVFNRDDAKLFEKQRLNIGKLKFRTVTQKNTENGTNDKSNVPIGTIKVDTKFAQKVEPKQAVKIEALRTVDKRKFKCKTSKDNRELGDRFSSSKQRSKFAMNNKQTTISNDPFVNHPKPVDVTTLELFAKVKLKAENKLSQHGFYNYDRPSTVDKIKTEHVTVDLDETNDIEHIFPEKVQLPKSAAVKEFIRKHVDHNSLNRYNSKTLSTVGGTINDNFLVKKTKYKKRVTNYQANKEESPSKPSITVLFSKSDALGRSLDTKPKEDNLNRPNFTFDKVLAMRSASYIPKYPKTIEMKIKKTFEKRECPKSLGNILSTAPDSNSSSFKADTSCPTLPLNRKFSFSTEPKMATNTIAKPDKMRKQSLPKSGCRVFMDRHPSKIVNPCLTDLPMKIEKTKRAWYKKVPSMRAPNLPYNERLSKDVTAIKSQFKLSRIDNFEQKENENNGEKEVGEILIQSDSQTFLESPQRTGNQEYRSRTKRPLTPKPKSLTIEPEESVLQQEHLSSEALKNLRKYTTAPSFFELPLKADIPPKLKAQKSKNGPHLSDTAKRILAYKSDTKQFLESLQKNKSRDLPPNVHVSKQTQQLSNAAKNIMASYKYDDKSFLKALPKNDVEESPVMPKTAQYLNQAAKKLMTFKTDQEILLDSPPREIPSKCEAPESTQLSETSTKKMVTYKADCQPSLELPSKQEGSQNINPATNAHKFYKQSFLVHTPLSGGLKETRNTDDLDVKEDAGADVPKSRGIENSHGILAETAKKILGYITEYQTLLKRSSTTVKQDLPNKEKDLVAVLAEILTKSSNNPDCQKLLNPVPVENVDSLMTINSLPEIVLTKRPALTPSSISPTFSEPENATLQNLLRMSSIKDLTESDVNNDFEDNISYLLHQILQSPCDSNSSVVPTNKLDVIVPTKPSECCTSQQIAIDNKTKACCRLLKQQARALPTLVAQIRDVVATKQPMEDKTKHLNLLEDIEQLANNYSKAAGCDAKLRKTGCLNNFNSKNQRNDRSSTNCSISRTKGRSITDKRRSPPIAPYSDIIDTNIDPLKPDNTQKYMQAKQFASLQDGIGKKIKQRGTQIEEYKKSDNSNQSRCLDPEKSRIPIPIRRGKKRLSLTSKQVLPSSTLKTLDHDSNNTKLDMLERRVDVGVNTESKVSFPRHFELRRSHSELYKSNTIFTKKSDLIKGKPTFLITRQFSSISKRHSFTTFPSTTYTKVENIEKKGMATKTFFENNEIVECANTNCDKKKPSVVCKKQYGDVKSKAPYPAFTECLSRPLQEDLPECPLEKEKADMLQPKEHLPCQKINLIEPVASSINNEDFSKEEVCVKEKMKITKTGLTETCANFGHTCKQIRQRDYLPGKSNCLTDINVNKKFGCKKFSTYALSDQIFSIFGTPKRPLYNFVYDQNGKGDVLMSMARKYHFFCKIADKKITEPAETSSDIKRHLPEMDYDCYKFMKLHDLQWRIDNFQKWHRLNRLNDCQSDFTRRYYSFIGDVREKDIHGVENCLIMPHDDYHSPEMREKCTCTNPDCKEAHYILMPKKDFFQKNSVCTKSSKTEEKLKKSSKYKLSDECNCLGDEDKQLQPKYPILPEQVSVSDLLFPEPVDINKKSNYMRYKYNIPNAGVTLDCDNFEESLASGKIRIKDYLKTQLPIEKDCRLASPEETVCPNVCCAPTYVDGTTSDVSLDFFLPSSVDGIKATATDFRSIVAKKKRPNEAEKRVSKADPCSQKISCKTPARKEKSCEKKKSPSVWNKIVGYFKARPDCPAPDEWKKKAAREKAERYAKAAGLCVCDPKILQKCDQTQRKPLKNKLVKQVKPETKEKVCVELPQVITCDSSQQKRSISFCAVTPPGGLKQRSSSMWLPDAVKGEGSINACSGRRLFCKHTTVSSGLDSFCLQTMQRKNFSTSTRHGKSNKSENDSVNNDSKSLDTISTNSQELIGDAFTELSQNIMDAENDHCESDNDSEDIDDNKSAKCAIGSTNLSDKCINVMTKRSYYEKGQNKNIDDINKTLEERDKQRLAEKIIRSLLEASINNHSEYEDFEEHGGNHEYGDPKLIYEHDEENVNANYTVLSRKTSLCEIIFQESEDEYTKYCQARSFANFIEGFRKMEVLSDVNYEDLEKIKTNKLVNELNKLIVDDNQTEN